MKNKLISLLLVVLLVFGTMAVLVSCGGKKDDPPQDNNTTDNTNQGGNNGGNNTTDNNNTEQNNPAPTVECAESPNGRHYDGDNDGSCDLCGKFVSNRNQTLREKWWEDIAYDQTTLIFELTKCTNNQELPSGCAQYMAGDTSEIATPGALDEMVENRNNEAYYRTKTTLRYRYCDDDTGAYGWSKNIDRIFQAVSTKTSDTPDMFCNFMTDMLATSLLGSFANLYSVNRGDGQVASRHVSFVDLSADGYMRELMSSLTLSLDKIYVVASDYFIDLIRAFFIVPVNRAMFDALVANDTNDELLADLNGDNEKNISDFFKQVENHDWTYETLAKYCNAVYSNTSGETTANLADRVGFALSSSSGLSSSGMVYTSSVVIIHKDWNEDLYDYDYYYPETNQELLNLTAALKTLFTSRGVISVNDSQTRNYGNTSLTAIRARFAGGYVLFGGVILLGSLEYGDYQGMKGDDAGFGIVPVPMYQKYRTVLTNEDKVAGYTLDGEGYVVNATGDRQIDNYLTQIHTVGRAGAIAHSTSKFTQCTAFLQYQSTHSTDILNRYYNFYLKFSVSDTSMNENAEMLTLLRNNVRTSFDKLFEDAIGFFTQSTDPDAVNRRWHAILMSNKTYEGTPFVRDDMGTIYGNLYASKQANLQKLLNEYLKLPD